MSHTSIIRCDKGGCAAEVRGVGLHPRASRAKAEHRGWLVEADRRPDRRPSKDYCPDHAEWGRGKVAAVHATETVMAAVFAKEGK